MRTAIGVDLGGSHVAAGVITEDGAIHQQHDLDIEDRSFENVVASVVDVTTKALADAGDDVVGIGVGSPGNVVPETGEVLYSPNFDWKDVPLGQRLREHFAQPVFVGNDARCATLGEYTFGSGVGTNDFALVTLGTGIGGGIVSRGHLLLGYRYGAGEVGHHQIRSDGFVCSCGKIGCFEAQASGTGLIRHAFAVAPSFPRSTLLDKPREKLSSKKIRRAAQAGDPHALAAWKNFARDLAQGVSNIIAFVNPELIALGGGVSTAGDFMLDAIRGRVDELTTMVPKGTTRIEIAKLGNDAGQVGAATMAFRGGLKTVLDE
jgi:glucokinase